MPFATVKGLGRIKLKRKVPRAFPKTIRIGNKTFNADKKIQKILFIKNNLAKGESSRLRRKFLKGK